jgi:hypothetical protein
MATATSKGFPFPEPTDPDKPRLDIEALARRLNEIPGILSVTQPERDTLTDIWPGMVIFNTWMGRLEINKSGVAGDWAWLIDAAMPVPIMNGGTGRTTAPSMLVDLSGVAAASPFVAAPRPGVTGILPIARGGTGVTSNPTMIVDLGSTSQAFVFTGLPRPGVTGTLPIARGGTGLQSPPLIRVDLGSTEPVSAMQAAPRPGVQGVLPITNGGTGRNVAPALIVDLGSTAAASPLDAEPRPGVDGVLPIARGGTSATTTAGARAQLGVPSKDEVGDTTTDFVAIFETALAS